MGIAVRWASSTTRTFARIRVSAERRHAGYDYSDLIAANYGAAKCETAARSYEMPEDR